MMKWWNAAGAVLLSVVVVCGQELVTLDTPVQQDPGATRFRVAELHLQRAVPVDRGAAPGEVPAQIRAVLREADQAGAFVLNGKVVTCAYYAAEAQALLVGLNKANLSVKSLERRVVERCQQDGKVGPGVLSGVPE